MDITILLNRESAITVQLQLVLSKVAFGIRSTSRHSIGRMKRSGAGIFCIQFSNAHRAKTTPLVVVGIFSRIVSSDEMSGSNDCDRLNGAERSPLEAVLIHERKKS